MIAAITKNVATRSCRSVCADGGRGGDRRGRRRRETLERRRVVVGFGVASPPPPGSADNGIADVVDSIRSPPETARSARTWSQRLRRRPEHGVDHRLLRLRHHEPETRRGSRPVARSARRVRPHSRGPLTNSGWTADVDIADRKGADSAAWGEPVTAVDVKDAGRTAIDLSAVHGTKVLVWFTKLGKATGTNCTHPYQEAVSELRVAAMSRRCGRRGEGARPSPQDPTNRAARRCPARRPPGSRCVAPRARRPRLRGCASVWAGNAADAADATQEALDRHRARIARFDGRSRPQHVDLSHRHQRRV